jgi:hypothetical protein
VNQPGKLPAPEAGLVQRECAPLKHLLLRHRHPIQVIGSSAAHFGVTHLESSPLRARTSPPAARSPCPSHRAGREPQEADG